MNDHNQKLEPTHFDLDTAKQEQPASVHSAPAVQVEQTGAAVAQPSQRLISAALAGLVVVAAGVFLWLPNLVSEPELELAQPAATNSKKLPRTQISPWSDAQLQRQRKTAQDVLALLLTQQFDLQELGVEQWAQQEFAAAAALANTGDELYRQQEFLAATESYQRGLDAMLSIAVAVPAVFEKHLQQGLEALQTNNAELALHELELARLIQADSGAVAHALGRAMNLEQTLGLQAQAGRARANNNLDHAEKLLAEAAALDPEHQPVQAELIEVRRDITKRDFNAAMTAGYEALDNGNYATAENKFLAARRIMPDAQETQGALEQARTARTRSQIDSYTVKAAAAEKRESWLQAIAHYQSILNIDETVVFARSGLIRSKARADLDRRLQQIIDQPARLSEDTVYNAAQTSWRESSGIDQKGPRLEQQLARILKILSIARTPVSVLLQSDEMTQVTVYKVAKLGQFRHHQLELKPGTYTAVGARIGYRDVRKEFTVAPDKPNPVIEISCTEPI